MRKSLLVSIISSLLLLSLAACGTSSIGTPNIPLTGSSSDDSSTSSPTSGSLTPSFTPLRITNVYMNVTPATLTGVSCGSASNITFTARLFANPGSAGGQVAYTWTINGASIPGTVTLSPGDTSKTVTYVLSGVPVQYNMANIPATLTINSPNQVTSPPANISGNCKFPNSFSITGISVAANPASLVGITCNTTIAITYTATITTEAYSGGGTALLQWQFPYFARLGRAFFGPGITTQTITSVITVKLIRYNPIKGTSIASTSPNIITSNTAIITGTCV